jgi:DNA-binding transcriptional LysR family regulator
MELRTLRYFAALAEELHFGRAAQRLAITQPPLSLAIRGLEQELGVELFIRTRRRVALTHAGSVFLEHVRGVLARAAESAEAARAAARGEVGRLAIGFMSASIYTLLPAVLRAFRESHGGVRLELQELTLPQQITALRRGDIQVAIVRPPVADAELDSAVVLSEPMLAALPAGHPLNSLRRIGIQRLREQPFVMFQRAPGLVLHHLVLGFCLQHGFTPRVAQEASQTHAVAGLVAAGIGVALVPRSAQEIRLRGVEYRPIVERTPAVETAIAWRRDATSPVVDAFVATARRVGRSM